MLDMESLLLGIAAGGGGGGNPNYIETIEGTLANPWGGHDVAELYSKIVANEITVYLTLAGFTRLAAVAAINVIVFSVFSRVPNTPYYVASGLQYKNTGLEWKLSIFIDRTTLAGSDVTSTYLPDDAETILTIIHHPMP